MLCFTGVSYINNSYSISDETLAYPQATFALERVYSDLTGIGIQLTIANPTGQTPFDFDTLGANHELDLRGQYGNNTIVVGAVIEYNLQLNNIYTAKYSIGPNLHGVMPRLTYDTLSRSIGFATDVVGLTY